MKALTKRTIYCIQARSSEGSMYAISGRNKAAREALAERYGKASPGGHHILTPDQLRELASSIPDI